MPTVRTAAPGTSVGSGTSVLTVKVQAPAGKPVAPPTGSTIHPVPSGEVGSDVSCVGEDVARRHVGAAGTRVQQPAAGDRARRVAELQRRRVPGGGAGGVSGEDRA